MACKSALSARSGKTRHHTNVNCCSLKIPPSSSTQARSGGAPRANAGGYIHGAFTLSLCFPSVGAKDSHTHIHTSVWPFELGLTTPHGPFPVEDMHWPLTSWGRSLFSVESDGVNRSTCSCSEFVCSGVYLSGTFISCQHGANSHFFRFSSTFGLMHQNVVTLGGGVCVAFRNL